MHHVRGFGGAEHGGELGTQLHRRLEVAIGIEVVGERAVQRAGDVAGGAIQRLGIPAVARRAARVQQLARGAIGDGPVIEQQLAGVVAQRNIAGRSRRGLAAFDGLPRRRPGGPAAIQHRGGNARQAQQPPKPRGRQRAAGGVIGHHLHAVAPAPARQQRAERRLQRQRVAAQAFGLARQVGQVAIEAGIDGPGHMALRVIARAAGGVGKFEAAINDQHVAWRQRGERVDVDQGGFQAHVRSILSSRLQSIAAVAPQMRCPAWTNSTIGRCCPRNSIM